MNITSGKVFMHIKTNKRYTVMCIANSTATKSGWIETVVYINEDNQVFARPISEFKNKFVAEGDL